MPTQTGNMGKSADQIIKGLQKKSKLFLKDLRGNGNCLGHIIAATESKDEEVLTAGANAFREIFVHLLENGEMHLPGKPQDVLKSDDDGQFRVCCQQLYQMACERLVIMLASKKTELKELSLEVLMEFVKAQGEHPLIKSTARPFPRNLFKQILEGLLSSKKKQSAFIESDFSDYLAFDDIRYEMLAQCPEIIRERKAEKDGMKEVFHQNLLTLMIYHSLPATKEDEEDLTNFYIPYKEEHLVNPKKKKFNSVKEQKRLFTVLVEEFLELKVSEDVKYDLVLHMNSKVRPFVNDQAVVWSFLLQAFYKGGEISVIATTPLYILITNTVLEIKDFYERLYQLIPDALAANSDARCEFFETFDKIFSTPRVGTNRAAGFIKKLAVEATRADPAAIRLILQLIRNMMARYPACSAMLDATERKPTMVDPYLHDEVYPENSNAIDSSLLELKVLTNHFVPLISAEAKRLLTNVPKRDEPNGKLFSLSGEKIVSKRKKSWKVETEIVVEKKTAFGKDSEWNFEY